MLASSPWNSTSLPNTVNPEGIKPFEKAPAIESSYVPAAVPQDFDTPTEVLARAVENHALSVDSAGELVNLFEEARFSPHVISEAHRETALNVLRLVLAELRSLV